MEASTGFKSRGSFGVPPEMKRDLEEQRRRAAEQEARKPEEPPAPAMGIPLGSEPPPPSPEQAEKTAELSKEEEYRKVRAELEADLETTITVDDVKDYIFKGRLAKEVCIIGGHLKGTFQSMNPTEYMEIDKRMATFRDESAYTPDGLSNQRAILVLSYVWVNANGRPLSAKNDPVKREEHIRKLSVQVVNMASAAYTKFDELLQLVLHEKKFIKKS